MKITDGNFKKAIQSPNYGGSFFVDMLIDKPTNVRLKVFEERNNQWCYVYNNPSELVSNKNNYDFKWITCEDKEITLDGSYNFLQENDDGHGFLGWHVPNFGNIVAYSVNGTIGASEPAIPYGGFTCSDENGVYTEVDVKDNNGNYIRKGNLGTVTYTLIGIVSTMKVHFENVIESMHIKVYLKQENKYKYFDFTNNQSKVISIDINNEIAQQYTITFTFRKSLLPFQHIIIKQFVAEGNEIKRIENANLKELNANMISGVNGESQPDTAIEFNIFDEKKQYDILDPNNKASNFLRYNYCDLFFRNLVDNDIVETKISTFKIREIKSDSENTIKVIGDNLVNEMEFIKDMSTTGTFVASANGNYFYSLFGKYINYLNTDIDIIFNTEKAMGVFTTISPKTEVDLGSGSLLEGINIVIKEILKGNYTMPSTSNMPYFKTITVSIIDEKILISIMFEENTFYENTVCTSLNYKNLFNPEFSNKNKNSYACRFDYKIIPYLELGDIFRIKTKYNTDINFIATHFIFSNETLENFEGES